MSDKDIIYKQDAIDLVKNVCNTVMSEYESWYDLEIKDEVYNDAILKCNKRIRIALQNMSSVEPEIIRCKNCKYWRQQTNYIGDSLSFGFCENDNMWGSLYGETCEVSHIDTDDDFYCGYAERRTE